jgi:peptide chain release factor 1
MSSVIVEIRAGTGGEEAALFAADLFKMYSKYGQSQEWRQNILDAHYTDLGGIKQIIFELKSASSTKEGGNGDIFSKMKYEGGVHRVQRIPKTEKSGRIHTSTATVAVLLKPEKTELTIKPEDLKIDLYRASGPGGQYVNKRETAVRITHLPTGIIVSSQSARNQLQNKENALTILKAKLLERREIEDLKNLGKKRKSQIGWAKREEKIRTYNFPQDRITDHRIKKNWHNIEKILDGKLDKVIKTLQKKLSNQDS